MRSVGTIDHKPNLHIQPYTVQWKEWMSFTLTICLVASSCKFSSAPFFHYNSLFICFFLYIHHLMSSPLPFLFTLFLPSPPFLHIPLLFCPLPLSFPFFLQPAPLRSPLPSVLPAHVASKLPQGVGQIRPTDKSHHLYLHELDSSNTREWLSSDAYEKPPVVFVSDCIT